MTEQKQSIFMKKGYVSSGKDIEELVEKVNLPSNQLHTTVITWNQSVANKIDKEFNRTTAMENDLAKPNYYAIKNCSRNSLYNGRH